MDECVRRYLNEELKDANVVRRAARLRASQFQFVGVYDDHMGRCDQWPDLADGKIENAINVKFMQALRSPHDVSPSPRGRTSRAPSDRTRRVFSAHTRPPWNHDTKHLVVPVDPLQKCLKESLEKRGFHENYEKAKAEMVALRQIEVERLKQKMAAQKALQQHVDYCRTLQEKWKEIFEIERARRNLLLRGEASIRAKIQDEFRRSVSLVVELTEFNQRKWIFKIALQQLDELKVLEREEFVERQMYAKLVKQREAEALLRQREVEAKRRRTEELRKAFHALMTEEITEREKILQSTLQKVARLRSDEQSQREVLLRFEILESIVYEEVLQRQLIVETRQCEVVQMHSVCTERIEHLKNRHMMEQSKAEAAAQEERLQMLKRLHIEGQNEFMRYEALQRSDVTGEAFKLTSAVLVQFHCVNQTLRLQEREAKSRKDILTSWNDVLLKTQESRSKEFAHIQRAAAEAEKKLELLKKRAAEAALKREQEETLRKEEQEAKRKSHAAAKERRDAERLAKEEQTRALELARLEEEKALQQRALKEASKRQDDETARKQTLRAKVEMQNKPFLGVTLAEHETPAALFIESMFVDGPADCGGLKLGDELVEVGGVSVSNFVEMRAAVKNHAKMGQELPLRVRRQGELINARILVMTADKEFCDLTDIYFDTEKHTRVSSSVPNSVAGSPDKKDASTNSAVSFSTPTRSQSTSGVTHRSPSRSIGIINQALPQSPKL